VPRHDDSGPDEIGNYCSIASGVWIHPAEQETAGVSTLLNVSGHVWVNEHDWSDGCKSGNDVRIGLNATILSSCKMIGDWAMIAAGAVVNANVPPYAIVGGIPAKVLKYHFARAIIKRLLASEWWTLSNEGFGKLGSFHKRTTLHFENKDKTVDLGWKLANWPK
jgi:acetyltransferase-like isoleucine patch superfamily enzyme